MGDRSPLDKVILLCDVNRDAHSDECECVITIFSRPTSGIPEYSLL